MNAQCASWHQSPTLPVRVDRLSLGEACSIYVLRDDLLPAGTKQRAAIPFLAEIAARGLRHFTYASPFAGFAQVALAYACHSLGLGCTLYCERDPGQTGSRPHAFTRLAESWGAKIVLVESLAEAEAAAEQDSGYKIPLGFHCAEFHRHFQIAVSEVMTELERLLGRLPRQTWLPVGSGTLAQAIHRAAPAAMQLSCVNVHVLPREDLRIQRVRAIPRARYFEVPEAFAAPARYTTPVPSNLHYDAKLWPLLQEWAQDGDLWWNVAR